MSGKTRILSIDQFRGYAILGMIAVNFLGMFEVMPWVLKHHKTGFSYADSIAPVFIFAVGMGFRLSLQRRVAERGTWPAYRRAARRYLTLMGLGALYGGFNFKVSVWDALMDIGCAGLLSLPFIVRSGWVRMAAAAGYLAVYQALFMTTGYGEWVMAESINGGPLGPLSWAFMLLSGTVCYDIVKHTGPQRCLGLCLGWAAGLMTAGWLLKMPWPGFKAEWPFSQYGMTAPYPLLSTGLCFLTFAAFYVLCDLGRVRLPHLTELGRNPLVLYLLQAALVLVARVTLPPDLALPWVLAGFAAVYGACYTLAHALFVRGKVIKL